MSRAVPGMVVPGGGALFLIAQMSQASIDGVLVLYAPVRRIGDDSDRSAAAAADFDRAAFGSMLNTRLSR